MMAVEVYALEGHRDGAPLNQVTYSERGKEDIALLRLGHLLHPR